MLITNWVKSTESNTYKAEEESKFIRHFDISICQSIHYLQVIWIRLDGVFLTKELHWSWLWYSKYYRIQKLDYNFVMVEGLGICNLFSLKRNIFIIFWIDNSLFYNSRIILILSFWIYYPQNTKHHYRTSVLIFQDKNSRNNLLDILWTSSQSSGVQVPDKRKLCGFSWSVR